MQRSAIKGDVMAFEAMELLTIVDLGRMPKVEGDISSFQACEGLITL